jgi:hypothetical protein
MDLSCRTKTLGIVRSVIGSFVLAAKRYISLNDTTGKKAIPPISKSVRCAVCPLTTLRLAVPALYMLCPRCRSRHRPEHDSPGAVAVALTRRTLEYGAAR